MTKKIKGAAKAKNVGKRTIKAKAPTNRAGVTGFDLNVSGTIGKKLALVAKADSKFKGSNPRQYAMFLIKNAVAQQPLTDTKA